MNIKVKAVSFNADQRLIDFINKKVAKLDTLFEGIISLEVTLKVEKPRKCKKQGSRNKSFYTSERLFVCKKTSRFL